MVADRLVNFRVANGNSTLERRPGNSEFGLLAPSIQYMDVVEDSGLLVITGKFGTEPGEVKIGGQNLQIDSWGKERIRARIPTTGPQSAGDVSVWSKGRRSNTRRLTNWRPTFKWEFITGNGSLKFMGELRLHFRADVASHREEPERPPKYRTVTLGLAGDSFGELEASGTNGDGTTRGEGVAAISSRTGGTSSFNFMDGIGEMDTETPAFRLALYVVAINGMWFVHNSGTMTPWPTAWALDEGPLSATNPLPAMRIRLDRDFAIMGDLKREVPLPVPSAVMFWSNHSPQYAPVDSVARREVRTRGRVPRP
jgi:hypothetical protein